MYFLRKDNTLSPDRKSDPPLTPRAAGHGRGKALFFASHTGSLTMEAALVLPIFLCIMLSLAWLINAYDDAIRLSGAMAQTAKEMALGAYVLEEAQAQETLGNVATVAYGSAMTRTRAGDLMAVKNLNFLLSKICDGDEMVSLTAAWQVSAPLGYLTFPFRFYVQKASTRAWVGNRRIQKSSGEENSETEEEEETVYVTATGQVYHTDENCTHLKLSIRKVNYEDVGSLRNKSGAKYYACEHCGGKITGGTVLITDSGNRYHADGNCSGLKRTVSPVPISQVKDLRPCSRCSGG